MNSKEYCANRKKKYITMCLAGGAVPSGATHYHLSVEIMKLCVCVLFLSL